MRIYEKPIFFNRNRVFRIYQGGKLFADILNDYPEDSFYPEEWIASTVKAINLNSTDINEGLSYVKNEQISLLDLMHKYPREMTNNEKWDVLVKFLDSAIRLPVQVHPNKEHALKFFNSTYGKTEMWIILGTRENACLYIGFKEKITKEEFKELVKKSQSDKEIMSSVMNRIEVKNGDIYLINSGVIHAIGAGCMLLEVQEPTDFTIQPECWCGDYEITEYEKYLGLSEDDGLEMFDYNLFGDEVIKKSRIYPKVVVSNDDYKKEEIINYNITPCFATNRYTITNQYEVENFPSLFICIDGIGIIECEKETIEIKKGDYFFIPYILKKEKCKIVSKNLVLIECLASKK